MRKVLQVLIAVGALACFALAGCTEAFPTADPPSQGKNIAQFGATPKAGFNGPSKPQFNLPDVLPIDAQEDGTDPGL